jgi:heme exporter protein D
MRGLVEFLSQGGYAFFVWSAFGMTSRCSSGRS